MKSIVGVLTGLLLLTCAISAQSQQEEMQAKYDAKLKKDFMSKVSWEKDFASAKTKAAAENKLLLAYFTRSYAN